MALEPVPAMAPLVVVAHDDPGTADSLRHAVETAVGWPVMVAHPSPGGMAAALAAEPAVALVGCAVLADLPASCRAPVVAIGDDERPADVRAALAAGARSLLAWPDGAADLPGELARVAVIDQADAPGGVGGLVVAVRGVHGGAGTTTVAAHLAGAWARWGPAPVLLVDLAGGLAFRLDLGTAPTWSTVAVAIDPSPDADHAGPVPVGSVGHPTVAAGLAAGLSPEPRHRPTGTAGALRSSRLGGEPEPSAPEVAETRPSGKRDGHAPSSGMAVKGAHLDEEAVVPLDGPGSSAAMADGLAAHGAGPSGVAPDESMNGQAWPREATGVFLDSADLVAAVAEPWAGLAVLPLGGLVDGGSEPPPDPLVVQAVLEAARRTYRLVVVDLPATDGPAVRAALSQADALVAVGRCESAGVRGLQAALTDWQSQGHDPTTAGAVVTGVRPQAPLAPREVRATLADGLWGLIPAAGAELAAAAEDGVLLLDRHDLPAVQAMLTLANRVVPFAAVSE